MHGQSCMLFTPYLFFMPIKKSNSWPPFFAFSEATSFFLSFSVSALCLLVVTDYNSTFFLVSFPPSRQFALSPSCVYYKAAWSTVPFLISSGAVTPLSWSLFSFLLFTLNLCSVGGFPRSLSLILALPSIANSTGIPLCQLQISESLNLKIFSCPTICQVDKFIYRRWNASAFQHAFPFWAW